MNAKELMALIVRVIIGVVSALLMVLLTVIAWQGQRVLDRLDHQAAQIVTIDKRVSLVEATRWTRSHAIESRRDFSKELEIRLKPVTEDVAEIKEALKELSTRNGP